MSPQGPGCEWWCLVGDLKELSESAEDLSELWENLFQIYTRISLPSSFRYIPEFHCPPLSDLYQNFTALLFQICTRISLPSSFRYIPEFHCPPLSDLYQNFTALLFQIYTRISLPSSFRFIPEFHCPPLSDLYQKVEISSWKNL